MSILEILEAHTGRTFDKDGMYVCQCGHYIGTNKGKAERHRAHVAQVLEQHERETNAEALEEAAVELNRLDSDVEMYDENLHATPVETWLRDRANQMRVGSE